MDDNIILLSRINILYKKYNFIYLGVQKYRKGNLIISYFITEKFLVIYYINDINDIKSDAEERKLHHYNIFNAENIIINHLRIYKINRIIENI